MNSLRGKIIRFSYLRFQPQSVPLQSHRFLCSLKSPIGDDKQKMSGDINKSNTPLPADDKKSEPVKPEGSPTDRQSQQVRLTSATVAAISKTAELLKSTTGHYSREFNRAYYELEYAMMSRTQAAAKRRSTLLWILGVVVVGGVSLTYVSTSDAKKLLIDFICLNLCISLVLRRPAVPPREGDGGHHDGDAGCRAAQGAEPAAGRGRRADSAQGPRCHSAGRLLPQRGIRVRVPCAPSSLSFSICSRVLPPTYTALSLSSRSVSLSRAAYRRRRPPCWTWRYTSCSTRTACATSRYSEWTSSSAWPLTRYALASRLLPSAL